MISDYLLSKMLTTYVSLTYVGMILKSQVAEKQFCMELF